MAKRSARKSRVSSEQKELSKRELFAKNKGKIEKKKDKEVYSELIKCKDCGIGRMIMPSDAHHVTRCEYHQEVADKNRRKLAMRARRAKQRKSAKKVERQRTSAKAA